MSTLKKNRKINKKDVSIKSKNHRILILYHFSCVVCVCAYVELQLFHVLQGVFVGKGKNFTRVTNEKVYEYSTKHLTFVGMVKGF